MPVAKRNTAVTTVKKLLAPKKKKRRRLTKAEVLALKTYLPEVFVLLARANVSITSDGVVEGSGNGDLWQSGCEIPITAKFRRQRQMS